MPKPFAPLKKVALVGDDHGIPTMLEAVPQDRIACLIIASDREQYHPVLIDIARSLGVPALVQSKRKDVSYATFLKSVEACAPDGIFCYSYSMKLQQDLLDLVGGRAFNVHASLLPKHRGPNPIQWALICGDLDTGVTLHQMSADFDQGQIVAQAMVPIEDSDTWVTLSDKLNDAARGLIDAWLPEVLEGRYTLTMQNETQATKNPRLTPSYPRIDFDTMSDRDIFNLIRAQVKPLKGAYIEISECERVVLDQWMPEEDVAKLRDRYHHDTLLPSTFA